MHVVITGGLGYIGSRIARRLLGEGHWVSILDNGSTATIEELPGTRLVQVDLRKEEAVHSIRLPAADCMMHLAGPSSGPASAKDPVGTVADGYRVTFNALELAARLGIKRFLNASSMTVYGNVKLEDNPVNEDHPCRPISHYAIGKFANERLVEVYCRGCNISYNHLRMFNVYGPGQDLSRMDQGLVSIFLAMLLQGPKVVSRGPLERFRDVVHIDDVVGAWVQCAIGNPADGPLNVGSGEAITIKNLIQTLADELGSRESLSIEEAEGIPGDIFGIVADISALRNVTGYSPRYSPERGVRQFARWSKEI
jgi:UDP-glucose 4-epimerase